MFLSEEMKKFVLEQRLGYHATVRPDGTPSLSHKGTTSVYDDEHLFFADIRSPQSVANLRANPAIEVNVVDIFSRRGYRFTGTATVHQRDEVYERALTLLRERDYAAYDDRVRSIVLIHVDSFEHMTSPAYDIGQTEPSSSTTTWTTTLASTAPATAPIPPGTDECQQPTPPGHRGCRLIGWGSDSQAARSA